VSIAVGILIVLGASALAFASVALVRRSRRPVVGNPGRGSPMAIVAGTTNAVLLAFVILAAFQTYNSARAGAAAEANAVLDMSRTAALFPAAQRERLRSDLVCYGRAVVNEEWPAMRHGRSSPLVDYWIDSYRAEFVRLTVLSPRQQVAFQDLLTQGAIRVSGRQQRLTDDTPTVPTPLWVALVFAGCVAVALQLGMADPEERLTVQGLQVAGVAAIVTTGLLVINFLDHPYAPYIGGIQPTAMRHTLVLAQTLEPALKPPCTSTGRL
jgi:hypothetical protein